jgi:SAM-dependent methyltransferase
MSTHQIAVAPRTADPRVPLRIGLEQYYTEAGPDYEAWSRGFNMHFGYHRFPANPLDRESMLEQMNREVLERLQLRNTFKPAVLDLGCGLGATLRAIARDVPFARLSGMTRVPWQVEQARSLNEAAGFGNRIQLMEGNYENTGLASSSYDGIYALESSCHAHGPDKSKLLTEAHRLLRPGGRLVVADGFLEGTWTLGELQHHVYRRLCECWVIEELAELRAFIERLEHLGFRDITLERLQWRVAPSVAHIPWVTLKFLMTNVVFGERKMTRARWNNVLAPALLPLVSAPLGPMTYCMITGRKE